ncbi:RanBP2-type domain-containing protein [Favolaschia claudopus]|uniref:RanBP2-type domain-containing protein n=1 Tax=Favolaschia claudopus TaxID=2862362 RepID=A0AAW0DV64_9AGAR
MPAPSKTNFDTVLQRLHRLSISTTAEPRSPLSPLGPPFSYSDAKPPAVENYAPRPAPAFDLSPQSSVSSSCSDHSSGRDSFDAFVRTQSRVVKIFNLPPAPHLFLASIFSQHVCSDNNVDFACADSRSECLGRISNPSCLGDGLDLDDACAALALSSPRMAVAAALESDLDPFNLQRLDAVLPQLTPQRAFSLDSATSALQGYVGPPAPIVPEVEYTLSSNPPNPRTSFRLGDWICRAQNCAAHNFGRNLSCIGCGCPRSPTATASLDSSIAQSPHQHQFSSSSSSSLSAFQSTPRPQLSPRFANSMQQQPYSPANVSPTSFGFAQQQQQHAPYPHQRVPQQHAINLPPPLLPSTSASASQQQQPHLPPPTHAHPLLTPSGRAFAVGGKVQNISSDPLSPCIMYWPDNEPFPDQGQIRPSGLVGVPQPPILNTGNRGPISHQPGDWICLKCNYLNWRRRKVCQTCLPYAEGNGDSISAAVQAERIALLTLPRSHSTTPAHPHRSFVDLSPPPPRPQQLPASRAPVHRSQSHSELGSHAYGHPIYQTGGQQPHLGPRHSLQHHPSPLSGQRTLSGSAVMDAMRVGAGSPVNVHAPAPLLPSFLQDIVQSPALSPSSTSSADLSLEEEYEYDGEGDSLPPSSTRSSFSQQQAAEASPLANIWRLDGEESKSLVAAFPLARQELIMRSGSGSASSSRNPSLERLRAHAFSSS